MLPTIFYPPVQETNKGTLLISPQRVLVLIPGGNPQAYWYDLGAVSPEKISPGSLVALPLRSRQVTGIVLEIGAPELDFATKAITGLAPGEIGVNPQFLELLQWMSRYYLTPLPAVLSVCIPKVALKWLFHPPEKRRKRKTKPTAIAHEPAPPLEPSAEQALAISTLEGAFDPFRFQAFLLHGITGSGKTLVYLHLARSVLARGKKVLVLLPEIGLTPQTVQRFESFLGQSANPYHSNLGEAGRRAVWEGVLSGEVHLIVGARSAALLPLDNLGLIVVDEEHDSSYKQDNTAPRYHARDLALWRGRQSNCPVVLGSATPSLESRYAAEKGRYQLLTLSERATGASQPLIHIVDMKRQLVLQGDQPLSIPLRDALQKNLDQGHQAILFLNRRGYAARRVCSDCGLARPCIRCDIPLVYHKKEKALICHHCAFTVPETQPCPSCGGQHSTDTGKGLEKIEEYLLALFPSVGIERLDRDSTQAVGGTEKILERFRQGEIRVLLGTQMVAKGHDFPGVKLVGVLDADTGLALADFRAQERAFQLITQVSGRAGRHGEAGQVFIQTYQPENPLLHFALSHDYASFFNSELERRRLLNYPPFKRLLLIEITAADLALADQAMQNFADLFTQFAARADIEVLGPVPAALRRLQGEYRTHLLAKGDSANRLQWAVEETQKQWKPKQLHKLKLRLDMDPANLM